MSFASMNGITQTRNALANKRRMGMAGTEQAQQPGAGMMGTSPQPYALSQYGGFVNPPQQPQQPQQGRQMASAGPVAAAGFTQDPNSGSRAGMQMPPQPQQAGPQFDPNDPQNAALAGYMNGR